MNQIKYQSLFNTEEITIGPTKLVVKRNKNKKCRCHHMRISSQMCTFGRCRHSEIEHPIFKELFS